MTLFLARSLFAITVIGGAVLAALAVVPAPTSVPVAAQSSLTFPSCENYDPSQFRYPDQFFAGVKSATRVRKWTEAERAQALIRIPHAPICEAVSRVDEQPQDFMKRVGQSLNAFAKMHGVEGCGYLTHNPDTRQFGIRLTTQGGYFFCVNSVDDAYREPGFRLTTTTLHNHPTDTYIKPSPSDIAIKRLLQGPDAEFVVARQKNFGMLGFSAQDYKAGPGYLVAGDLLWHQRGRGTQHIVGAIAE
jgi:hypothetical protein